MEAKKLRGVMMKNVLIVSGHTDLENDSVANRQIIDDFSRSLPDAEIDVLSELYGDYKIDIDVEQKKLERADVIVLQFPLFWYGMPSIMNKWMEDTFKHGWSHGSTGDKLQGKKLIASFTAGAPEEAYHRYGLMGYEIEDYLPAIKSMCGLCGMEFVDFVFTGGVSYELRSSEDEVDKIRQKAKSHTQKVISIIESL